MPRAKKTITTGQAVVGKQKGVQKSTVAKKKTSLGTLSALVNSTDDEDSNSNASEPEHDDADVGPQANKNSRKPVMRGPKTIGNGRKRVPKSTSEDVPELDAPEMNGPKPKKARSKPLTAVTNMAGVASSTPQSAIVPSESKPRQAKKPVPKSLLSQKLEYIPETQNAYDNDPPSPATDMQQLHKTEVVAIESGEAYRTLQKHYDALQTRFSQLSELRETTAEAALSSYRESAERRYAAADDLIATLRAELSERSNQIKMMSSRVEEATNADRELDELEKAVQKLQQENAVLQSKLLARGAPVAGAGGSAAIAQLKEDLFSDLSGLIIRDVRVEQDKTLYDCLQTGRNGAFHYKISIPRNPNDGGLPHGSATANGSGGGYEDTEITFVPMLDDKRDAFLMSLLPDYFTEPLTFMRSAAAQCYWKIAQALQKKL
ncbi:chromosome segregation protein Csm1/Pcs1-domain-containing protein [Lipomyces kononenkoae]